MGSRPRDGEVAPLTASDVRPRLRVVITGASGLVRSAPAPPLGARGHEVLALSRASGHAGSPGGVRWVIYGPLDVDSVTAAIDGVDAVVNLAGHNLFANRWNDASKERMRS